MMRHVFRALGLSCLAMVSACTSGEQADPPKALSQGEGLYRQHCAACHDSGPDKPGTVSLATRYQGAEPGELVKRTNLTPEYVAMVARQGMASMPSFRKTEIDDASLSVLATWLAAQGQAKAATD